MGRDKYSTGYPIDLESARRDPVQPSSGISLVPCKLVRGCLMLSREADTGQRDARRGMSVVTLVRRR
jgi:hypothetical protein